MTVPLGCAASGSLPSQRLQPEGSTPQMSVLAMNSRVSGWMPARSALATGLIRVVILAALPFGFALAVFYS